MAIEAFGPKDNLTLMELAAPELGADRVLVRVGAAGVGPWDVAARRGEFGERQFPYVPGFETAGVVERVGEEVEDFGEGDEVFAYRFPGGGYAEYLAAPARVVARKPASLSFEEAAGVPVASIAAHQVLTDELAITEGESILITAAAGGVGTFATQIAARVLGARVIGTASPHNHEHLRSLGAQEAINYHDGDWPAAVRQANVGDGVDAVLDCAGGQSLEDSFGAVRDRGRVVSIVSSKKQPEAPSGIEVSIFGGRPDIERLSELGALFEEGWLSVHVEEVLALEEAVEAHERIEAGHTRGKIVLSVG